MRYKFRHETKVGILFYVLFLCLVVLLVIFKNAEEQTAPESEQAQVAAVVAPAIHEVEQVAARVDKVEPVLESIGKDFQEKYEHKRETSRSEVVVGVPEPAVSPPSAITLPAIGDPVVISPPPVAVLAPLPDVSPIIGTPPPPKVIAPPPEDGRNLTGPLPPPTVIVAPPPTVIAPPPPAVIAPPIPEVRPMIVDLPRPPTVIAPLPEVKPIISNPTPPPTGMVDPPDKTTRGANATPLTPGTIDPVLPDLKASPVPERKSTRLSESGEPPLAPPPGPVLTYQVRVARETLREIARKTLSDSERWVEIHKLNPGFKPEVALLQGTMVRLPADACLPVEELGAVKPLPNLKPDVAMARSKTLLPLTGTYPCNLDDQHLIALPRALLDQIGDGQVVLVSPGPDRCLWVSTQPYLERLTKRLEASPAREHEVRSFRRLYFAQTEKLKVSTEGRIQIPDRLAQFAGLNQEVVIIGGDDHFELWDAARWRQYTQTKSAAARAAMSEN